MLIAIVVLGGLTVAGLLLWAYWSQARWTGFVGYAYTHPEDEEHVPGKTLWDWLQLLLIPATLSGAVLLFNNWEGNRERERAEARARVDRQVAINDQRERALQAYLDQMSGLILGRDLRRSNVGSDLRIVARTRTLSTLRSLDGARRGILVRFLSESELLEKPEPLVNLRGADLSGALIEGANLSNAYLSGVSLVRAHLADADLREADLSGADLGRACLRNANLDHAVLDDALFSDAYMSNVSLNGAGTVKPEYNEPERSAPRERPLVGVDFSRSFLVDADGADTKLAAGNFEGAYYSEGTTIEGVDLHGAGARELAKKDREAVRDERWGYCS